MMAYLMFAGSKPKVFSSFSRSGVTHGKLVLSRIIPLDVVSAQLDSVCVPMKVFDNLYFIGTQTESTWALTTSKGIILLNTNFPWVTPDLLNELKTFGLDPANIKYAIIVRSHSDQSWGINPLKKMVPSARVIMSEKDWD